MTNEIVFDIETQNTFAEVENDFKKFRISVVSIYEYADDKYTSFAENELGGLWPLLEKADRIIGYNSEHFDLPILNNYYPGDLLRLPHLDIIKIVFDNLGKRLKLKDIAEATLDNITKSADGLQAIHWWKQGEIDKIKEYCEQDVKVTKEIYDFGKANKQLFYKSLTGEMLPFAVNFEFQQAFDQQGRSHAPSINLTLPI
ncbi:MAG: ribonuclease H-like domain-containing protein [bacterium]